MKKEPMFFEESKAYIIPEMAYLEFTIEQFAEDMVDKKLYTVYGEKYCPRCGADMMYTIPTAERSYRICKTCGMLQELEGKAYQCELRGHICKDVVRAKFYLPWDNNRTCSDCGKEIKKILSIYEQLR